ncbi:hypothetical protein, partial [Pseudomonas sp. MD330_11]|uniref:hypothetical protein n=1 Tax=Pseudomonas sp. MD330_11 TaxID=3241255 RepID=UPI0036D226A7
FKVFLRKKVGPGKFWFFFPPMLPIHVVVLEGWWRAHVISVGGIARCGRAGPASLLEGDHV